MKIVNYTQARQKLAELMDSVVADAEEAIITRSGHEPVVIVSLAEWESIKETEYLLRDPEHAALLRRGIAALNAGEAVTRELVDPDATPGAA